MKLIIFTYIIKIGFCESNRNPNIDINVSTEEIETMTTIAQKKTAKKFKKPSKLSYSERRKLAPMAIPSTFRNGVPWDYRLRFFNFANTHPIVAKRQFLFDALHEIDKIYRRGVTCRRNLTDLVYWYGQLNYDLEINFALLD